MTDKKNKGKSIKEGLGKALSQPVPNNFPIKHKTHKEHMLELITTAQKDNPGEEIVVYMHPLDYAMIEGMKDLPVRVLRTRSAKMGKIIVAVITTKKTWYEKVKAYFTVLTSKVKSIGSRAKKETTDTGL